MILSRADQSRAKNRMQPTAVKRQCLHRMAANSSKRLKALSKYKVKKDRLVCVRRNQV